MRKRYAKPAFMGLLAAMLLGSGAANSEEYMYRDLMGNTLPSARCMNKIEAEANAKDEYLVQKREKVFCQLIRPGLDVKEILITFLLDQAHRLENFFEDRPETEFRMIIHNHHSGGEEVS